MTGFSKRPVVTRLLICAVLTALAGPAIAQQPPGGGMPGMGAPSGPTEVGVITLHAQSIAVTMELPGRVLASQTADVRPQVGGIVKMVDFKPGQPVKAGDILFELDDAVYQAQLAVQQAALQKAQAVETSAQAKVDRYQQLATSVSQSDLLDAQASLAQAKADVASAQANVKSAELNLSLVEVTAPISGIISEAAVTQGGLVTAAQASALATIRTLDPVYVDMVDTSANLLKMRSQVQNGAAPAGSDTKPPPATIHLILENGAQYAEAGTIYSPDVVVSESTGSFSVRATFPNAQRTLLPGMFVRAIVDVGIKQQGFLVPQRAVTFDSAGHATALFAENGKAVSRVLTTTGNSGNDWIVTAGIDDGAQVIVDGLQKVQAGADVKPLEVTLDDDGVVVEPDTAQQTSASAGAAPASTSSGTLPSAASSSQGE